METRALTQDPCYKCEALDRLVLAAQPTEKIEIKRLKIPIGQRVRDFKPIDCLY